MATITIDLCSSLHARGFSDNERVHSKAFSRVKTLIHKQLSKAENHKEESYLNDDNKADFIRYYNTISILGERGVGKTSFLMSLRKEYENNDIDPQNVDQDNEAQEENEARGGRDICILPLIDPTLFEEKGHLFLLIVSLIEDQISAVINNQPNEEQRTDFEEYQRIRNLLSQGLPTLDNEGMTYTEPQWHEDEYMMVRGMESVKAAFDLERNFHKLVYLALKVLNKKAFMLMFDDIDVDFKKGWMVLETLRKFLTTPQLIILLSGNMKLYSKNVRKQQWRNFGKELLKNEMESGDAGKEEYARLVNEIEGQYMQKVLKSENRVFLYSINENILINEDKFNVKFDEDEAAISLQDAYKEIFSKNGIKGAAVSGLFSSFLMSTSMRTQIHFLYNMHNNDDSDLMSKISSFTSRMYAQNIDVDLITNQTKYDNILLHFLINKELLEEAYQLIPNFESTDVNSALTGFTFVFSHIVKTNPYIIFDYWSRICMVRNNMHYLTYNSKENGYVGKFCIGAGVYQSRDLRSVIGNSMAFLASLNKNFTRHDGCIPLLGFGDATKGSGRDLDKRIDKVLSRANDIQKVLGYLPLVTLLYDDKNGRSLFYSIYTLLANIGQIVKADDILIQQVLRSSCVPVYYQVRTYDLNYSDNVGDTTPDTEININDQAISDMASCINTWKESYKDLNINYGNYIFGRISTRLYYSFVSIVENNKKEPLGKVFHLFVTNILNACLIEESKIIENENIGQINISNVSTSAKILADNIGKLNGVDLPFTKWMAACPLLYPYINPSEYPGIIDFVRSCCNNNILDEGLLTREGCMMSVLDKIACLHQKSKLSFSLSKKNIAKTLKIIIKEGLNIETIMGDDVEAALQELNTVFAAVKPGSLTILKDKCRINNGILEIKPKNNLEL